MLVLPLAGFMLVYHNVASFVVHWHAYVFMQDISKTGLDSGICFAWIK